MNINMTQTLKNLRKQKNVTQEQLATHLGISAQSVGKWERGEGFPDITLLPDIAMYFGVTVDDLLEVGKEKIKEAIGQYEKESHRLRNAGDTENELALWEKAYKEFPSEDKVKYNLMNALYYAFSDRNADVSGRIISLGEELLEESTDTGIREGAIQLLCYTYDQKDDKENAKKYANMMGEYCTSKHELMKTVLCGEEAVVQCQNNIRELTDMVAGNAYVMSWQGAYTPEEKIRIYRFCIRLYGLLYENGDYGFYSCRMAQYYKDTADEYARLGMADECIRALESMCGYAVMTDTAQDFRHSSFIVNRTEYRRGESTKNYTENECGLRLNGIMKNGLYNFVRDDGRFKAVIDKLKEYAN